MSKYLEAAVEIIDNNKKIDWSKITSFPTIIQGRATRRIDGTLPSIPSVSTFGGVEMTGTTNIRAISRL